MTDKKTRVILIRHGESNVTVQRILGGEKSCTGLSELGQQQATALRDRLAKEQAKVDYLYASTMPRAMETAEIIQPALNLDKLHLDSELVEHRPGEADGKPYDELQTLFGESDVKVAIERSKVQLAAIVPTGWLHQFEDFGPGFGFGRCAIGVGAEAHQAFIDECAGAIRSVAVVDDIEQAIGFKVGVQDEVVQPLFAHDAVIADVQSG